jgi:hypothetical protein
MLEPTKPKILKALKQEHAKKAVSKSPFDFPNRLWESLVLASELKPKPNGPIYPKHNCKTYPIN